MDIGALAIAVGVAAVFGLARETGFEAVCSDRSPNWWGIYALLIPGFSYLHLRYLIGREPKGLALKCRVTADPMRYPSLLVAPGAVRPMPIAMTPLASEESDLTAVILRGRELDGQRGRYERTGVGEFLVWFFRGVDARATLPVGAHFSISDRPAPGFRGSYRRDYCSGEVLEILDVRTPTKAVMRWRKRRSS